VITEEKPGTPAELVHFGVLGMKWGVRRTQGTHSFTAKNPTAAKRAAEIGRARESVQKTKSAYKAESDPGKRKQLKDVHLNNPDRATALRLTKGEKIVAGLLYTLTPTAVVPLAVSTTVAVRTGKRRALES
jgi:hypothetical protein